MVFSYRIQPEAVRVPGWCTIWITGKTGAVRQGVMTGSVREEVAEALGEALGLKIERE